jgi:hypothetical protein
VSTSERIKKMWYMYTMECYSAIKMKPCQFATTWIELEAVMLNEIIQEEDNNYYMTSFICGV